MWRYCFVYGTSQFDISLSSQHTILYVFKIKQQRQTRQFSFLFLPQQITTQMSVSNNTNVLCHSFSGSEVRGSHRAKIKVSYRYILYLRLWGKSSQAHSDCWSSLIPCSFRTKVPISLLAIRQGCPLATRGNSPVLTHSLRVSEL